MKTYKIHLIRHGLTQGNLDGQYVGHRDIPVCEQGILSLRQMKEEMTYPDAPVRCCAAGKQQRNCFRTRSLSY